jgi:hypothetical protein
VAVRVLLVVVALACAAWVGASLQGARLAAQASGVVADATGASVTGDSETSQAGLARAARLLERSRKWAPYQASVDSEAGLLYRTGQRKRGLRLLRDLLEREPENSDAWQVYASLLPRGSPERARAERRVRELSPLTSRR